MTTVRFKTASILAANLMFFAFLSPNQALGNPRDPANYTGKGFTNPSSNTTGVKGTFSSGTSHLTNTVVPASPLGPTSNPVPLINKDIWLITNEYGQQSNFGCWIEGMVTKTNFVANYYNPGTLAPGSSLPGNSFNGYWIAVQRALTATQRQYTDYPYGANNSATAASGGSVEIVKGSTSSQWVVKFNGTTALTLNGYTCAKVVSGAPQLYYPSGGSIVQVGIEANDDSSSLTFTNGTQITGLQSKLGAGSYATLPNVAAMSIGTNNVNWTSTYSNGQFTANK
jgi:hypothetical protein